MKNLDNSKLGDGRKKNVIDRSKTGRAKGTPNKATKEIKQMIEGALNALGGQKYLEQQALENPVAFMGLIGKILPKDVNVGGQQDNPLLVKAIQRTIVYAKKHDDTGNSDA